MTNDRLAARLAQRSRTWLVTGAAGFIGSHLIERLLRADQEVRALDNLSTGNAANIEQVREGLPAEQAARLRFIEGDIRDLATCQEACAGVDHVLHQAALGSVPRSVEDPLATHASNVDGFVNILVGARDADCTSMVYASSSSVYGDHPQLPKREEAIGNPLSPYAASKRVDEIYATAFATSYDMRLVGLRYFNVFGPRQDPNGPYAAVIPRWIDELVAGRRPVVNGDGSFSRDFCPVANVVRANLLAALVEGPEPHRVYNVGLGRRTTLLELFDYLRAGVVSAGVDCSEIQLEHGPERAGDVPHSKADISRICDELGFEPEVDLGPAFESTVKWYVGTSAGASEAVAPPRSS